MAPICPICGTPLMESRQRLKCPNRECSGYEEGCCEGGPQGGIYRMCDFCDVEQATGIGLDGKAFCNGCEKPRGIPVEKGGESV